MVRTQNAMLTKTDREFLPNQEEYYAGENAKQQRYERRDNIRQRIRESILDFTLLFDHLSDEELAKIFQDEDGAWIGYEDRELHGGARDALALILYETGINYAMDPASRPAGLVVDELLEEAVSRAGLRADFAVEEVEPLEIKATRLRHALRGLEEGDKQMDPRYLGLLIETGMVDEKTLDSIQDLIRQDVLNDE